MVQDNQGEKSKAKLEEIPAELEMILEGGFFNCESVKDITTYYDARVQELRKLHNRKAITSEQAVDYFNIVLNSYMQATQVNPNSLWRSFSQFE
jgi:hypothetical protein